MCHDHEVNDEDEVVVHIEGKGGVLLQWLDVSGKSLSFMSFGFIYILNRDLPTDDSLFLFDVCCSEWVNPNLPDYVQNKLRKAMERPTSENDKPGYIYAYQLLESKLSFLFSLFFFRVLLHIGIMLSLLTQMPLILTISTLDGNTHVVQGGTYRQCVSPH
ncbi:MAG: hypothetical protein JOS17DRAFT_731879, partial [Linnemannia elongata]